ncbi:Scr1 family TA system antitoxin-like transcriptional regulator [Streptomyces sp. NPDC059467]|uniref:helix-turn-helix domain-containing protein n=1 Tax=Streptomyces sp. NPDC059467 TaxID=3346844 RepID=UPI00368F67B5
MTVGARDLEPARSARELYGAELRRQRQLARMSLDRLSDVVNYSKTHLHGVETGERLPLPPISEKLDAAFGTGELFQGLWGVVKREHTPRRFDHCLELEAKAVRIQAYGSILVPGLLQTSAYMRALFRKSNPNATPEEVGKLVSERLSRQERLRGDTPPEYWAILDEAILRRGVGGQAVMHDQLASLLPLVDTERTTIQVVPFYVGEYAGMSGSITLLTLPDNSTTVYEEGSDSGEIFDDRETATRRLRDYDRMKACALSPEGSAALIKAAMENFKSCEPHQT